MIFLQLRESPGTLTPPKAHIPCHHYLLRQNIYITQIHLGVSARHVCVERVGEHRAAGVSKLEACLLSTAAALTHLHFLCCMLTHYLCKDIVPVCTSPDGSHRHMWLYRASDTSCATKRLNFTFNLVNGIKSLTESVPALWDNSALGHVWHANISGKSGVKS